jgi:hypothetical protein
MRGSWLRRGLAPVVSFREGEFATGEGGFVQTREAREPRRELGVLVLGRGRHDADDLRAVGSGADERLEIRDVCTLALSFDHRHVDGEKGSRFLADVAAIMEDPAAALLF